MMALSEKSPVYSGKVPIHRQIIATSYVMLDKMVHMVCGPETIPIAFNTDSFKARKMLPYDFAEKPTFGDIRKEAHVNVRERYKERKPKELVLDKEQKGALFTGPAGSGKTEMLKTIYNESKGKKIVLTPTNIAAINLKSRGVEASTIDKFFESVADVEKKIDTKKLNGYDAVFIDEYSQVAYKWWHTFMRAKMNNPNVRFYIFGDANQCFPVENFLADVTNSDLMKF